MVAHGAVNTQPTEYRVFRRGFYSRSVYLHSPAMGNAHHRLQPEPVFIMTVQVVDEAVVNPNGPERQPFEVTERHPAHPEPVNQHRYTKPRQLSYQRADGFAVMLNGYFGNANPQAPGYAPGLGNHGQQIVTEAIRRDRTTTQ